VLLHHFVFMVISFAILGLGLGGIWAYRIEKNVFYFFFNHFNFFSWIGGIVFVRYQVLFAFTSRNNTVMGYSDIQSPINFFDVNFFICFL